VATRSDPLYFKKLRGRSRESYVVQLWGFNNSRRSSNWSVGLAGESRIPGLAHRYPKFLKADGVGTSCGWG